MVSFVYSSVHSERRIRCFSVIIGVVLPHADIKRFTELTQLGSILILLWFWKQGTKVGFTIGANGNFTISFMILTPPSTPESVLESHRVLCLDRHHLPSKGPNRGQCSLYHSEAPLQGWSAAFTALIPSAAAVWFRSR